MNEFSVKCRISKKDRAMLSAYSIMHSSALMFLTVIFLVILVYLPICGTVPKNAVGRC